MLYELRGSYSFMRFTVLTCALLLSISLPAFAASRVENASRARASDVAEAEKFLASLPDACSMTRAFATSDGTVHIRILCNGSGKAVDGLVSIRNGIVTNIK
jgi:hypothetical protein